MQERVKRIFRNANDGIDLILFWNAVEPHLDMSFFYATGITDGLFEGCGAWLTPDGGVKITTSALEEEAAKKSGLPYEVFRTRDENTKLVRKLLRGHRRIGVNASELTHAAFLRLRKLAPRAARFVDISSAVMKTRLVKDAQEIDLIQRACDIASRAFEETLPFIRTGVTEAEVAAELVYHAGGHDRHRLRRPVSHVLFRHHAHGRHRHLFRGATSDVRHGLEGPSRRAAEDAAGCARQVRGRDGPIPDRPYEIQGSIHPQPRSLRRPRRP